MSRTETLPRAGVDHSSRGNGSTVVFLIPGTGLSPRVKRRLIPVREQTGEVTPSGGTARLSNRAFSTSFVTASVKLWIQRSALPLNRMVE